MFVNFADEEMTIVNAVFANRQTDPFWAYQDEIEWDDPRFQAYYNGQGSYGQEMLRVLRDL